MNAHKPPQETVRCRMDHAHGLYHSHEQGEVAYYHERQRMIHIRERQEITDIQCIGSASAMLLKPASHNDPAKYPGSCRPQHYSHGNSCTKSGWVHGVFMSKRCIMSPAFDTCGESGLSVIMIQNERGYKGTKHITNINHYSKEQAMNY